MGAWAWWKRTVDSWAENHAADPKPWTLFKHAMRDYRQHVGLLMGIVLIVAIPVAVLSNFVVTPGSDTTLSAYVALAQLILNLAVIYTVIQLIKGKQPTIREAYYRGSAALVRLLLVSVMLILMLVFAVFGLFIIVTGAITSGGGFTGGELALLTVLGSLLAIPSVILITRSFWAIYIVIESDSWPVQAIRQSRAITKGRVVVILSRVAALVLFLILLMLIPMGIFLTLQAVTGWMIWSMFLQILASVVVLPLANFYLYRYYQRLK